MTNKNWYKVSGECPRCCGKGTLPHFAHVMGGTCFRCQGTGKADIKLPIRHFDARNETWYCGDGTSCGIMLGDLADKTEAELTELCVHNFAPNGKRAKAGEEVDWTHFAAWVLAAHSKPLRDRALMCFKTHLPKEEAKFVAALKELFPYFQVIRERRATKAALAKWLGLEPGLFRFVGRKLAICEFRDGHPTYPTCPT